MTPIFSYFIVGLMLVVLDYSWHRSKEYLFHHHGISLNLKNIRSLVLMVLINGSLGIAAFLSAQAIFED
jgi:hypothetical protein